MNMRIGLDKKSRVMITRAETKRCNNIGKLLKLNSWSLFQIISSLIKLTHFPLITRNTWRRYHGSPFRITFLTSI